MAETVKKTKSAAKPRAAAASTTTTKNAAKKNTVAGKLAAVTASREEIARLAEQYWAERGRHEGQAEQDWLRAERELMKLAS